MTKLNYCYSDSMTKMNCFYRCKCGTLHRGFIWADLNAETDVREWAKTKVKCKKCGKFAMLESIVKAEDI